jgi:peptidoglycan/LPS O-acetylase OafA/YrhL
MNNLKSLYLELLRIFAAFYVFLYHVVNLTNPVFLVRVGLNYPTAHCCVMIFFVLSGYLISISVSKADLNFKQFITARLGRLYSVLIPALIFSFVVEFVMITLTSPSEFNSVLNYSIKFILNIMFLSQVWNLCATPPLNTPFWSVSYEFFYYLILGTSLLSKKRRYWVLTAVVLIGGIKILLLFPVWFIGNIVFRLEKYRVRTGVWDWVTYIITTTLLINWMFINPDSIPFSKDVSDRFLFGIHLFFSWNYQADYIFSFVVAVNMLSFFHISEKFKDVSIDKILFFVRRLGNCTYTLYMFHVPLLLLYKKIYPFDNTNLNNIILLSVLVFVSVIIIAIQTEWKVEYWRNLVNKIYIIFERSFYGFTKKKFL